MVRICDNLVNSVTFHVLHHVPLHVFLNDGAKRIGVDGALGVHAGAEELTPALHRVAESSVVFERLNRYNTIFHRGGIEICNRMLFFIGRFAGNQ